MLPQHRQAWLSSANGFFSYPCHLDAPVLGAGPSLFQTGRLLSLRGKQPTGHGTRAAPTLSITFQLIPSVGPCAGLTLQDVFTHWRDRGRAISVPWPDASLDSPTDAALSSRRVLPAVPRSDKRREGPRRNQPAKVTAHPQWHTASLYAISSTFHSLFKVLFTFPSRYVVRYRSPARV